MTKQVRIENADMSPHRLVVEIWEKGNDGEPDRKIDERLLLSPTNQCELVVTSTRYLVVRELVQ